MSAMVAPPNSKQAKYTLVALSLRPNWARVSLIAGILHLVNHIKTFETAGDGQPDNFTGRESFVFNFLGGFIEGGTRADGIVNQQNIIVFLIVIHKNCGTRV